MVKRKNETRGEYLARERERDRLRNSRCDRALYLREYACKKLHGVSLADWLAKKEAEEIARKRKKEAERIKKAAKKEAEEIARKRKKAVRKAARKVERMAADLARRQAMDVEKVELLISHGVRVFVVPYTEDSLRKIRVFLTVAGLDLWTS